MADHTLALILDLTRQIILPPRRTSGRAAGSLGMPLEAMRALSELTVGVVGFGRIGREVGGAAAGLQVPRSWSSTRSSPPDEIERPAARPSALDELLRTADLVTLHCPSIPEHPADAQPRERWRR